MINWRKIAIILFLFFHTLPSFSQKNIAAFYDENWLLTDREHAVYFRSGIIDTLAFGFQGKVRDYSAKGQLLMEGSYVEGKKEGLFRFFSEEGKLWKEGNYVDNKRSGRWLYYHPNGQIKEEIYFEDVFVIALNASTEEGESTLENGTGDWVTQFVGTDQQLYELHAKYKDRVRVGRWKYFLIDTVNQEVRKTKVVVDDWGKKNDLNPFMRASMVIHPDQEESRFQKMEAWEHSYAVEKDTYPMLPFFSQINSENKGRVSLPSYTGGIEALNTFFQERVNLKGQKCLKDKVYSTSVEVQVDYMGRIQALEAIKQVDTYDYEGFLKNELIRIISQMPNWVPAMERGALRTKVFPMTINAVNHRISLDYPIAEQVVNNSLDTLLDKHYLGGKNRFYKTIAQSIKYPATARRYGVEGLAQVSFKLSCTQGVDQIVFLKSLKGGIEEELKRVLESLKGSWVNCESLDTSQEHHLSVAFILGQSNKKMISEADVAVRAYGIRRTSDIQRNTESTVDYTRVYLDSEGVELVEVEAHPKRGITDFYETISRRLRCPEGMENFRGKVYISFEVAEDGSLDNLKMVNATDPRLEQEIRRVMSKVKPWIPGMVNGTVVRSSKVMPVAFGRR
ncbi:hypothetical protein [Algivirga pacifica]|uniref:TonB C-terminal domain-containing protein n=1 Tax=Algivirga pacifica TaxID=1162670 RepID=A0ABP9DSQ2_9BACT